MGNTQKVKKIIQRVRNPINEEDKVKAGEEYINLVFLRGKKLREFYKKKNKESS